MKKGCGLVFVVWIALVGAYGYVAWQRIHDLFPAAVIGILGGTFAAMMAASFAGLFTGARDRAALRRADNADAAKDGRLEAASGPIRPIGAALEAPFTGRACVAYEYDVKPAGLEQSEYAGVALAPSTIDTIRGSVGVLGWAMLDQFPADGGAAIDRERGARYLRAAVFEPLRLTSIISILSDLLADDDGSIRKDFRIAAEGFDLQGRVITEKILPVGAVITILGRWSEEKRGFAPAGGASINRIFPGDLESTRRQAGGNTIKTFFLGLAFFLALHAILVPMYFLAPAKGTGQPATAASVWDERDCDRQKTLLAAGADANESGRDALTPLMNAAREGEAPCVENLIAAGARLETTDRNGDTALAQAITAGRDANVEILRAAGAKDFRVTAKTGRAVTDVSPPLTAVKDYIAAVHRGDFQAMARLMAGASAALMEERRSDLPFWQSMRPKSSELAEGWMNDEEATLTIHGVTPSGDHRVSYQLEHLEEGWRIKKEWFPDVR